MVFRRTPAAKWQWQGVFRGWAITPHMGVCTQPVVPAGQMEARHHGNEACAWSAAASGRRHSLSAHSENGVQLLLAGTCVTFATTAILYGIQHITGAIGVD
jgi:hypothetical protein